MDHSEQTHERSGQPVAEGAPPAAPSLTPTSLAAPANGAASEAVAAFRPIAREAMQERRRKERETGVPFFLEHDGTEVRVRLLNLLEETTLLGLPEEIKQIVLEGFNTRDTTPAAGSRTWDDMMRVLGAEERMANAACITGFVAPRLTATKAEADAANDPAVWWVEEIDLDDRKRYLQLVSRQNKEEMERVRKFLRGPLAGLQDPRPDGVVPAGTAAV